MHGLVWCYYLMLNVVDLVMKLCWVRLICHKNNMLFLHLSILMRYEVQYFVFGAYFCDLK
jgi:hypothetical protein